MTLRSITVRAIFPLCLFLANCAVPPDLPPRQQTEVGPAPHLLPISDILAQAAATEQTQRLTDASAEDRAAALRTRAAALRAPVFPEDQRARMTASGPALR